MSDTAPQRPCPCCETPTLVSPSRFSAEAELGDLCVPVTALEYVCPVSGETWENSRDHDWRAEARGKLNARLGNPPETRLPGVRLRRPEAIST